MLRIFKGQALAVVGVGQGPMAGQRVTVVHAGVEPDVAVGGHTLNREPFKLL